MSDAIGDLFDLIENGPWPVQALCTECGSEHTSTALTRDSFKRLEAKLIPHGTCAACIAIDEGTLRELMNEAPKEETLPNLEDVREQYETDHADPSDPFDGRSDLF